MTVVGLKISAAELLNLFRLLGARRCSALSSIIALAVVHVEEAITFVGHELFAALRCNTEPCHKARKAKIALDAALPAVLPKALHSLALLILLEFLVKPVAVASSSTLSLCSITLLFSSASSPSVLYIHFSRIVAAVCKIECTY
jgi:hypothetical protein